MNFRIIRRAFAAMVPATLLATGTLATSAAPAATTVRAGHGPIIMSPFGTTVLGRRIPFANTTTRTTFVAGGATLPALAYEGSNALRSNPSTPSAGSIFGFFQTNYTSNHVVTQYCQTGSGFGKKLYNGTPSATGGVNAACPPLGTSATASNGFGAPAALGLTDADITGTDSPLTQAEYSQFVTAKSAMRGEPVEIPSIVGAVAIAYTNANISGGTQINLSDSQICGIVRGTVTNWNQLGYPSKTIHFVYRSDGSGTTFSFSNHLSNVCGSPTINTSQNFTGSTGVNVVNTPPPGSVGAAGNAGVASAVKGTDGAIGYVEAANALSIRGGSTNFAKVNSKDPIKNLPESAFSLTYANSVVADQVIVANGGAASTTPLSPPAAKSGCVQLVRPAAYARLTSGYPIVAVTYFLFSTKGNGGNAGNLQLLVNELENPAVHFANQASPNITTVDGATNATGTGRTGYASLPSTFNAPLNNVAKSCIGA